MDCVVNLNRFGRVRREERGRGKREGKGEEGKKTSFFFLFSFFFETLISSNSYHTNTTTRALQAPDIPPEILNTLLNLAEFLEHHQDPLPMPITPQILGDLAEKNHAYAKVFIFIHSFIYLSAPK